MPDPRPLRSPRHATGVAALGAPRIGRVCVWVCGWELAGLIFSLEALKTQKAPAEQGVIYSDCQSAMAIYQRTRSPLFNPMASPHGRNLNSVLQLYLAAFPPFSPETDFQLRYIPAHCDEQDQTLISEDELPIFQGHYQWPLAV